jgi:hypothetical protein
MPTLRQLVEHLAALALQHNITLDVIAGMKPERALARAGINPFTRQTVGRRIQIAPVTEESTYVVALHEMGHLVAPNGMSGTSVGMARSVRDIQSILRAEQAAWDWAKENAIEWSVAMEQNKQMSLGAYEDWALRLGRMLLALHKETKHVG